MKRFFLTTALVLGSVQAFGALSASMERVREYKELLSHPQLLKNLGAYRQITLIKRNPITFPQKNGDANFRVDAEYRNYETMKKETCTTMASVKYSPSGNMGPKKMTVYVSKDMSCYTEDF